MKMSRKLSFLALLLLHSLCFAAVPNAAKPFRDDLTREAHVVFGLSAPIPALAAQIEQESGWRPGVTAWDNGRGLAQFMDGTADWVADKFDLGTADPYNPKWAIRAMVRLDGYNVGKVQGATSCDKWGAALKGYNAGLGYVQRAQKSSTTPELWFGSTELINAGQSQANFEASRLYPHKILVDRQPKYGQAGWGKTLCENL